MSLNFDFTAMEKRLGQEEYDRITDSPFEKNKWHPVTDALIWMSLFVGLPGITEENADEFTERALAYQALLGGGYLDGPDGKITITGEDIQNHIGMRTNVGKESKTKFYAKLFRMALEEGKRNARGQKKSAYDVSAEIVRKNAKENA